LARLTFKICVGLLRSVLDMILKKICWKQSKISKKVERTTEPSKSAQEKQWESIFN